MADSGQQFYKEEDAEQILRLAASFSSPLSGGMSRERLLATAAELGIAPEAVEMAEKQLATTKVEEADRLVFDQHSRRDFYGHLASYIAVNAFLVAINALSGGYPWALWPLLGWGIAIVFHAVETFFRSGESYQDEFDKWRLKRRKVDTLDHALVEPSDFMVERFIQMRRSKGQEFSKNEAINFVRQNCDLALKDAEYAVDSYDLRNPGIFGSRK